MRVSPWLFHIFLYAAATFHGFSSVPKPAPFALGPWACATIARFWTLKSGMALIIGSWSGAAWKNGLVAVYWDILGMCVYIYICIYIYIYICIYTHIYIYTVPPSRGYKIYKYIHTHTKVVANWSFYSLGACYTLPAWPRQRQGHADENHDFSFDIWSSDWNSCKSLQTDWRMGSENGVSQNPIVNHQVSNRKT